MKIDKAIILSAGYGTRLLPITKSIPKPLLKIGNETLLSNTIRILENFKIKEVVINVHYLSEKIISFLENKKFNLKISIVKEENEILDTGGGIFNAIKNFDDNPFMVLNPDTVWTKNYIKEFEMMESFFLENNCENLLLVANKNKSFDQSLKGDFTLENKLLNRNFKNKIFIYVGAQIIKKKAFESITSKVFSINQVWDYLISKKKLFAKESKEEFLHITNLEIYNQLKNKF